MRVGINRHPLMVILLSFITCGIYYFYWIYTVSKEMNEFLGEEDIPPVVDLLLMIFTGTLWGFVWDWRTGQKVVKMAARVGLTYNDDPWLYLALDLLGAGPVAGLGLVVMALEQSRLNEIYDRARAGAYASY